MSYYLYVGDVVSAKSSALSLAMCRFIEGIECNLRENIYFSDISLFISILAMSQNN